jgi:hypothetical protein
LKFRTEISPVKSDLRIGYHSPLFFTGSCFSEEIGLYLERGKFDILINPFGVLYNPASVSDSLSRIIAGTRFTREDISEFGGRFLSLSHDTSFSSESAEDVLKSVNSNLEIAEEKLRNAHFLFVTFGTARIYRLKSSGRIVSNCHKIPAKEFKREILSVDEITDIWKSLIQKLREFNSKLNIIFTVSPVRHWKDGAHGNQLSKSTLLLAIDRLISDDNKLTYFPSYEIMIDDLRDYRFYRDDLLHPSKAAVEYIWDFFTASYFDNDTLSLYREVKKVLEGTEHRFTGINRLESEAFKRNMLNRISHLKKLYPFINLEQEQGYFRDL